MEPQIQIEPIEPMVYVQPWPLWAMVLGGLLAALLLVALGVWIGAWWRRARAVPPPTPRETALAGLATLGGEVNERNPYEFSVGVSDVLRRYVSAAYELPATSQTSPEFLASVAEHPSFSEEERELLKRFLEKADLIKFARLHASAADSEALLEQAKAFLKEEQA